ncbi:hypothetical protein NEF87_000966 [Candidatus Lokiarchaeum ossiferum]|uniref:DUF3096 domain-containing protein n=1 Tax=Candidatus Lokiarchaeum ossiferum TaxID=2951803 RepID=A0ABY6HME7_9ARCH|nr:hypothetical protein NEF87_000966 [Candidatus Lokiarchaeum sp. B-35]
MKLKELILLGVILTVIVGLLFWYNPIAGGFLGFYLLFFLGFQLLSKRKTPQIHSQTLFTNQ